MHWLKKFLYKKMLGFTKNNELFSDMVRRGDDHEERSYDKLCEDSKLPEDFLAEFVAAYSVEFTRLRAGCFLCRKARENSSL